MAQQPETFLANCGPTPLVVLQMPKPALDFAFMKQICHNILIFKFNIHQYTSLSSDLNPQETRRSGRGPCAGDHLGFAPLKPNRRRLKEEEGYIYLDPLTRSKPCFLKRWKVLI